MIIGVSGKIASGKSEVLKVLKKKGFYCIDADEIVRELYKSGGEGARKIKELFGPNYLNDDGSVNRKKLREFVFVDKEKLDVLNDSIHPFVFDEIRLILKKNSYENVAIEAAYFESNCLGKLVDKIWWVVRERGKIIDSLVSTRDFSYELAEKAVDLIHEPDQQYVDIFNNSSLEDLEKQVLAM